MTTAIQNYYRIIHDTHSSTQILLLEIKVTWRPIGGRQRVHSKYSFVYSLCAHCILQWVSRLSLCKVCQYVNFFTLSPCTKHPLKYICKKPYENKAIHNSLNHACIHVPKKRVQRVRQFRKFPFFSKELSFPSLALTSSCS